MKPAYQFRHFVLFSLVLRTKRWDICQEMPIQFLNNISKRGLNKIFKPRLRAATNDAACPAVFVYRPPPEQP